MKKAKRFAVAALSLVMAGSVGLAAVACGGDGGDENDIPSATSSRLPYTGADYTGTETQGISFAGDTVTIKIGNTAATSGAFASVGVPFNYGLETYLNYWAAVTAQGKVVFDFKHYDDGFDGSQGLTYTKKLVEEDEVFALVGHFGTNTIEATVNYIIEKGVPMVYAATGVSSLYNEAATKHERAILPIQPIFNTEGRSMLATAVAPTTDGLGLGGSKIGVIYTSDDAGINIASGVKTEAKNLGVSVYYKKVDAASTDYSAAVNAVKAKGCDVVIIAANQGPFSKIAAQFVASNYNNVKVITSYVSSNTATMGELTQAGFDRNGRELYAGSWLDIMLADDETDLGAALNVPGFSPEYWAFATLMSNATYAPDAAAATAGTYAANSYAMAGYAAGLTFTQGLERLLDVSDDETDVAAKLTWKGYIDAMESAPVTVALSHGNTVDYANGSRLGVTALSLSKYTNNAQYEEGDPAANKSNSVSIRPLTQLSDLEDAYKNQ